MHCLKSIKTKVVTNKISLKYFILKVQDALKIIEAYIQTKSIRKKIRLMEVSSNKDRLI